MKVGELKKFSFGNFLVMNEIIPKDFKYEEIRNKIVCPHCAMEFGENITYNIVKVFELKGIRCPDAYVGISDKGHILKLPEDQIKELIKK
jgi:hypothetical protein